MINEAPVGALRAASATGSSSRSMTTMRSATFPTRSSSCSPAPTRPAAAADCFGGEYPRPRRSCCSSSIPSAGSTGSEYHHRFRTTARVVEKGTLTPISALFPSTTAASVSTLNLGVLPSQHALYEWNIYVPAYGEVIQSLAFSPLGRRAPDACLEQGLRPRAAAGGARDRASAPRAGTACAPSSSRTAAMPTRPTTASPARAPRWCATARWPRRWCS